MFRFRLEPVLKYRSRIVEKFQRELAVVNNSFQQENSKLESLMSERKNNFEEYNYKIDKLSLDEMLFYDNYFNGVMVETTKQKQAIARAQKKVDEMRNTLIEAVKQKKIIETVKNRDFAEYKYIEKKKEEALLDEITEIRFKK